MAGSNRVARSQTKAKKRVTATRGRRGVAMPMARIYDNILETVGDTPVIKINKLAPEGVEMYVKAEYFNPLSSVKDRLAVAVITDAERKGLLKPGDTVVEATSGNTGESSTDSFFNNTIDFCAASRANSRCASQNRTDESLTGRAPTSNLSIVASVRSTAASMTSIDSSPFSSAATIGA